MPSGSNTSVCIALSYAAPSSSLGYIAWPPVKPPAAAIRFEYWNSSPNFEVGIIVPSVLSTDSGVEPFHSNSHSRSWRGRPVHAQIRCLISTCLVTSSLPSLKLGRTWVTGSSQVSFLASTSLASISVVSVLVFDAIMNIVLSSTVSFLPSSRTPMPPAHMVLPSSTTPNDTPGTPVASSASRTKFLSCSSLPASSLAAVLPPNDSREYPLG